MPGKKLLAVFAIMAALALCACVEQGAENQTAPEEIPETPTEIPAAPTEETGVQQPRRQDVIQPPEEEVPEPVEEPVPEVPEIQPPEEPVPEEPAEEPGAPEQVPGFEAYIALVAIGIAGAAVALTHRKKKE